MQVRSSSADIYENGEPELVEWELFQIVFHFHFYAKNTISEVVLFAQLLLQVPTKAMHLFVDNHKVEFKNCFTSDTNAAYYQCS